MDKKEAKNFLKDKDFTEAGSTQGFTQSETLSGIVHLITNNRCDNSDLMNRNLGFFVNLSLFLTLNHKRKS